MHLHFSGLDESIQTLGLFHSISQLLLRVQQFFVSRPGVPATLELSKVVDSRLLLLVCLSEVVSLCISLLNQQT